MSHRPRSARARMTLVAALRRLPARIGARPPASAASYQDLEQFALSLRQLHPHRRLGPRGRQLQGSWQRPLQQVPQAARRCTTGISQQRVAAVRASAGGRRCAHAYPEWQHASRSVPRGRLPGHALRREPRLQRRLYRAPDGHPDPSHDAVGEVVQRLALEEHEEPRLQAGRRRHRRTAAETWVVYDFYGAETRDRRARSPSGTTARHPCARRCGMVHMPLTGAGGKSGPCWSKIWVCSSSGSSSV